MTDWMKLEKRIAELERAHKEHRGLMMNCLDRMRELERKVMGLWHDVYLRQPAQGAEDQREVGDDNPKGEGRGEPSRLSPSAPEPVCATCGGSGEVCRDHLFLPKAPCPDCQPEPKSETGRGPALVTEPASTVRKSGENQYTIGAGTQHEHDVLTMRTISRSEPEQRWEYFFPAYAEFNPFFHGKRGFDSLAIEELLNAHGITPDTPPIDRERGRELVQRYREADGNKKYLAQQMRNWIAEVCSLPADPPDDSGEED